MNEKDIHNSGNKIDQIEVKISYKIIELFSAGLYSSPNKAFEELICNSYDAGASIVSVYIPEDLTLEGSYIFVADNGEGLNKKELKDLWLIGESQKRKNGEKGKKRLQIGQFGIGKLSTYILARNLSYISKKESKYLLATMDYNRIQTDTEKLMLDEIELSEEEAKAIINKYTVINGKSLVNFEMFGKDASKNWTLSLLTGLKPKAVDLQLGRLKWILQTALPLSPQFSLYLNNVEIESSKTKIPVSKEWIIGQNDRAAEDLSFTTPGYDKEKDQYYIDFETVKNVHGKFILYKESLLGGKSSENGRSHGIFLMIRGRLVNLDDPLLGMPAFSHGPFNHCQIIINADGLDPYLTSTRESVKESSALAQIKTYIQRKFNELKTYYFSEEEDSHKQKTIGYRLSQVAYSSSQKPISNFIIRYFDGKIENPILIEKPINSKKEELLPKFDGESDISQVIEDVKWEIKDSQSPIGKLDLTSRILTINTLHPYVSNYFNSYKSTIPLENIVIAEVLMEAYMYELGIDESMINSIIYKRDEILRQLAFSDKEGIPAVAQLLHDSLSSPTGLETAVYRALMALGFEVQKIGGNGKPDGFASANLGHNADSTIKSYTLTYDAKSTGNARIAAGTAKLSGIKRHQTDYSADFALEVSIGYAGEEDPESAISKEATQQKVTVMKANDLARLLLYSVPKQLGLSKLKTLFETCYTPAEVTKWVDDFIAEKQEEIPYNEIIEIIYDFQKEDTEPPTVSVIRQEVNKKLSVNYSTNRIKDYLQSLENIIPGQFHFDGEYAFVECTPSIIKEHIKNAINKELPVSMQEIYNGIFK